MNLLSPHPLHLGVLICFLTFFSGGCTNDSPGTSNVPRALRSIVCTTGMVGDLVQAVVGPEVDVQVLMSPGVDPHLFTPSPRDISQLSMADAVVYNGLHLEAGLSQTLENLEEDSGRLVYSLATPLENSPDGLIRVGGEQFDPHFWNDLELWQQAATGFANKLAEEFPDDAARFQANAEAYNQKLAELLAQSQEQISAIPPERRILISAHDAFEYFGRSLGLEVAAVQGISTNTEASVKKVEQLVSRVVENKIPAIFAETSVSDKAIQAIIAGAKQQSFDVRLGGTLYSDALGPAGSGAETFPKMYEANVKTIVEALK